MLDVLAAAARAAGGLDRLIVVHADLGDAEWPEKATLAAEHATFYVPQWRSLPASARTGVHHPRTGRRTRTVS